MVASDCVGFVSLGRTHIVGWSHSVNAQGFCLVVFALRKMSSLYKPFSVSDAPCKDALWRRGCESQQHPPHPAASLGVTASSFSPVHNVCEGKRRFAAAAAPSGRKITHPGKAILAGKRLTWCSFKKKKYIIFYKQTVSLVASQSRSCFINL